MSNSTDSTFSLVSFHQQLFRLVQLFFLTNKCYPIGPVQLVNLAIVFKFQHQHTPQRTKPIVTAKNNVSSWEPDLLTRSHLFMLFGFFFLFSFNNLIVLPKPDFKLQTSKTEEHIKITIILIVPSSAFTSYSVKQIMIVKSYQPKTVTSSLRVYTSYNFIIDALYYHVITHFRTWVLYAVVFFRVVFVPQVLFNSRFVSHKKSFYCLTLRFVLFEHQHNLCTL